MNIKVSTDLLSGLFFAGLGAASLYISWRYPVGAAARMGPGYFPTMVGSLLVFLGSCIVVRSLIRPGENVGELDLRPLLFILLGTLAFGLFIEHAGLLVASVVLIVACRFARPDFRPVEVALLAVGLAGGSALLFYYVLGLNFRLTPF